MEHTAEFERMWSSLSPQLRTSLMAEPDRSREENEVVQITGSGNIPGTVSDAYWVLTSDKPAGCHLTAEFRDFIERKRRETSALGMD